LAIQYQELQHCNEIPKGIVLGRILVCKPHSADCERVISLYNKVKSTCTSSLKRQTMSDYLYIHINMPPLSNFDPRPATLQWMDEKECRTRNTPKAGEQEWFSKVFLQDNSFENEEAEEANEVKRKF
jgi:hypothetical protein